MNWQNKFLEFKTQSQLDGIEAIQARENAFSNFLKLDFPTKKEEAWKYTSLNSFKNQDWNCNPTLDENLSHQQLKGIASQLSADFYGIVFVNGKMNKTLSSSELEDQGIEFFDSEIQKNDFLVLDKNPELSWIHFAQSFWRSKMVVKINENTNCVKPIQIILVTTKSDNLFSSEKLNIIADKNSLAQIILQSFSFDNHDVPNLRSSAKNLNISISLAEKSHLQFIDVQDGNSLGMYFSQTEVIQNSNSVFKYLVCGLANQLSRNYFHNQFLGQHAESEIYGLNIVNQNQHSDHYTFIEHSIGENQSIQHYKTIISDKANSVFRGRVLIEKQAQKANSKQLNNNLLLTRDAQAFSVPQLEIYADDVKASHGSTIGQLNKDELFYFLSRGINQLLAVKMLSYGYVKELVYKFDNQDIQKFLIKKLEAKLESIVANV